jgi:hypothetical protein
MSYDGGPLPLTIFPEVDVSYNLLCRFDRVTLQRTDGIFVTCRLRIMKRKSSGSLMDISFLSLKHR